VVSQGATSNNKEIQCIKDTGPTPDWFPESQEVWKQAMNHVSNLNLANKPSYPCFTLPPIHLFWGGGPENQHIYYYHYLLLFNEIKNRSERDLPALSTQDWRSVLGDTYWKKQWPRPDRNNPSAFDPNVFWKYGALSFSAMRGVLTSLWGIITPPVGWLVVATSIWPWRTTPISAR
jgi:hypothetical protein